MDFQQEDQSWMQEQLGALKIERLAERRLTQTLRQFSCKPKKNWVGFSQRMFLGGFLGLLLWR